MDFKVTWNTGLILKINKFWKLSPTVLELDFRADIFCSTLNKIQTHSLDTLVLQHQ
jgi:hypothetical protein